MSMRNPMFVLSLALCTTASATELSSGADRLRSPGTVELTTMPFNVAFVPPLAANSFHQYRTTNVFSLNILLGNSAALGGMEVSGLGSRNGEVRGAQLAGIGNWVDPHAYGQTGDARGLQIGGVLNWTGGSLRGVQLAGVLNVVERESSGAQLAGAVNVASDATVQLAGAVNFARGGTGLQVAPVNVSGQARGAQIGVVNVAEEADVSVGVFSWVRNGTHDVAVVATEYGALAQADTGGRVLYGILTAGAAYGAQPQRYLAGFGIGWRALAAEGVKLDVQAVSMQMVDQNALTDRHLSSARAVVAMRVVGPLSAFAGPTFNVFVDSEARKIEPVGYGWKIGSDVQLWPGFLAGLRLF